VAAKGPFRYLSVAHLSHSADRPENDPAYKIGYYRVTAWDVYRPNDRILDLCRQHIDPAATLKARGDPFFECLGWWPPDDKSTPPTLAGRPFFLRDALARESFVLRPTQEFERGHACHVLDAPGRQRLWVDAAKGVVLRRECFAEGSKFPDMTYDYSDYQEAAPGLWLPHGLKRTQCLPASATPVMELAYSVRRYEVNAVPDSLFEPAPGPGTLVRDVDTDCAYQVPGGLDLLEEICIRAAGLTQAQPDGSAGLVQTLARYGTVSAGMGAALYGFGWSWVTVRRAGRKRP
jgi:hypothetical protein